MSTARHCSNKRSSEKSVAPVVHIPLAVMAALPGDLVALSELIMRGGEITASSHTAASIEQYRTQCNRAYDQANNRAGNACNAFEKISNKIKGRATRAAFKAARNAKSTLAAIYESVGNFYNDECFQAGFKNQKLVEAAVQALRAAAGDVAEKLQPFGY